MAACARKVECKSLAALLQGHVQAEAASHALCVDMDGGGRVYACIVLELGGDVRTTRSGGWHAWRARINQSFNACAFGLGGVGGSDLYFCSAATRAFCTSGQSIQLASRREYKASVGFASSHALL